jgi:hypothetical protein
MGNFVGSLNRASQIAGPTDIRSPALGPSINCSIALAMRPNAPLLEVRIHTSLGSRSSLGSVVKTLHEGDGRIVNSEWKSHELSSPLLIN